MLNEKIKQYVFVLLLVFILFFLDFLNLLNFAFLSQFANLWKEQNFIFLNKISKPVRQLKSVWHLTARLEDLQYRYAEAAVALTKVKDLEKENQELRKFLENSDRSYQQVVITAPIISFANSFVAVGSKSAIKTGSAVLYKGTLLGLIDQVEENQSSVLLLHQLFDLGLLVETNTGVKGLLRGNGREILLTEVPSDAQLVVGDLVSTSAQVGIEKGLLIGRVAKILTNNQASATKTAVVEQLINFYDLSLVEIK